MTMHCLVIESLRNSILCILSGVLINGLARIVRSLARSQTLAIRSVEMSGGVIRQPLF
jgi:hypothetical protein